jgi:long-chain fatty acid transport protein
VKQQVFQIGAGAAFQPLPYLKLGASFLRYQLAEELHLSLNYLDHYGDAGLGLAGGASTFGVAGEFTVPTIPLTIGVTYKHTGDMTLTGDSHFTSVPAGYQAMLHDQRVTEKLTVPSELYIGAAYEVIPDLKIMAAYSFERWSVYTSDTFVGDDGFMAVVPRNYNNAYVIRLAGEWQKTPFLPELALRLGALRSMSSQPSETVSPSLTDGESTAFSVGAGYTVMPDLRIDLGAQFAFFDKVTASGPEAFPGSYKTTVQLISIGANYRFGRQK